MPAAVHMPPQVMYRVSDDGAAEFAVTGVPEQEILAQLIATEIAHQIDEHGIEASTHKLATRYAAETTTVYWEGRIGPAHIHRARYLLSSYVQVLESA